MKFNFFFKTLIVGILIIFIASCDRNVNEIGESIVGDNHYGLNHAYSDVLAYNQTLGPVQTNNLPINQFGVYNNPVFGKTTASFVTQVSLASANPSFINNANVVLDSVYLYVPYFATLQSTTTDANGYNTYTLDSIQPKVSSGTPLPKIKLSVYELTEAIESYDPDPSHPFQNSQKYYSDSDLNHGMTLLNDDNTNAYKRTASNAPITDNSQNEEFVFNDSEIQFYKRIDATTPGYTDVAARKAPGMFLNLNKTFFQNKIMNAIINNTGKLFNNSVFQDYFKGLYFKAENAADSPTQGSLAMINFSAGYIKLVYSDDASTTDHVNRVKHELTINLSGNSFNLLNNDNTFPNYAPPSQSTGDRNLYLKGGNGSMAVIDLFGGKKNNASTELQKMRDEKWLINEANLTFNIDQSTLGSSAPEPNRIYLYDLTNNRPLGDYYSDYSTNPISKFNKSVFGGILVDGNSKIVNQKNGERGTKYKINITNYLRTLVKNGPTQNSDKTAYLNSDGTPYSSIKDSTNVRLGLVVTESINASGINYYLKSPFTTTSSLNTLTSKYIPQMSVLNPLGTILYGSNIPATDPNYDKRLRLEIYYTKPN